MATVEDLLSLLRGPEPTPPGEILHRLGISQPTLSCLVREAGPRVCRIGQARATRYARTREIAGLGAVVPVWQVDEAGRAREYGRFHLLAGAAWLQGISGTEELFLGIPPVVADMSPKGYLGRSFSAAHSDLGLPRSPRDWDDSHSWIAVVRRGEDGPGDLILGEESFNRFLARQVVVVAVDQEQYPDLARRSASEPAGSSVGGEQPKFSAYLQGRWVLVKFTGDDRSAANRRWRDLLAAEALALSVLAEAGFPAAMARLVDFGRQRFLEVERFDRVGRDGRRGLLSLSAIDGAYLGGARNWTEAARFLREERLALDADTRRMVWLDTFGQLIANDDRHSGNLSFFVESDGSFRLAPVSDMLPMRFAPQGTIVAEREFRPAPPTADNHAVWPEAVHWAGIYWQRVARSADISPAFRRLARTCREIVSDAI